MSLTSSSCVGLATTLYLSVCASCNLTLTLKKFTKKDLCMSINGIHDEDKVGYRLNTGLKQEFMTCRRGAIGLLAAVIGESQRKSPLLFFSESLSRLPYMHANLQTCLKYKCYRFVFVNKRLLKF